MSVVNIVSRIFIIILLCRTFSTLKVYNKLLTEKKGSYTHHTFQNGLILYSTCNWNNDRSEFKCDLFREKSAYQNDTYHCEFTLKSEQQNGTVHFRTTLDGFGDDKVLIGWEDDGEQTYMKFNIITLNGCKTSETKLIARKNQSLHDDYQALIYDDKFYVIFENHDLCGEKLCRMTVDADGKVTSGPESYFENIGKPSYYKVSQDSSSIERFFFVSRKKDETSLHLVKPDGSTKILTRMKNLLPPYLITTSNNLFGICYTIQLSTIFDTEIKCAQYNVEGNLKLEMRTKDVSRTKMMRKMHNLPEGGFVFVDEDFANCEPNHCPISFVAEKWDANGRSVGKLDLGQRCNDTKARVWTSFFENESNEYCLTWTCRTDGVNEVPVAVRCFNDTDLVQ